MHGALKAGGYVVGGLGLAALVAVGVSRLLRNYHLAGTIFPFPLHANAQPLDLPEATQDQRNPSRDEWTLIQAAGDGGWPITENMTFRTRAGQPCLKFVIEGVEVELAFGVGAQDFVVNRYNGPGAGEIRGTHLAFDDFLKKAREA